MRIKDYRIGQLYRTKFDVNQIFVVLDIVTVEYDLVMISKLWFYERLELTVSRWWLDEADGNDAF